MCAISILTVRVQHGLYVRITHIYMLHKKQLFTQPQLLHYMKVFEIKNWCEFKLASSPLIKD